MRILLAEDDPIVAVALARRLEMLGHEPLGPARDGVSAVAFATTERPDLCLFDIDMPVMDGLAAARALNDQGCDIPVIVVTGVDDPALVAKSAGSGVDGYLSKPVSVRELSVAVQFAVARHNERRVLRCDAAAARADLEERKLVERAKGQLMRTTGVGEDEAYRRMQRFARDHNLRLADLARKILDQEPLMNRPPGQ